ncbi:tryptophan-rich sensory protein [Dyadobacter sp.]|uniref:tryptophan-rich sensory protein n=1 Tax=Dyadobacter sp. TaxID=1914288 RepID=UPI003F6FE475
MKRTLQISNIVALLVTILVNYLSNTGVFNGNTMASVSGEYQNLFTPAGYAFSIWGIIYISLAGFIVYQSRGLFNNKQPDPDVANIGWLFVLTCVANCLWIVAWLYDYTGVSVLIMCALLFFLIQIILNTRMEMELVSFKKVALLWWPFALYTGWILLALVANAAAFLTKIEWNRFGLSEVTWTLIMITIAGLVYLYLTWTRNLRESAIVGIWGLIAVAVANWDNEQTIAYYAIAMSVVLFISNGIHGYQNKGRAFVLPNGKTM